MSSLATFNARPWTQWLGLVFRVVIGGLFIYAGYLKLIHLNIARNNVFLYRLFPFNVSQTIGMILPVLEVSLGLLLVIGIFTRVAALGIGFLLVVYITGIISVWARHISIDCGCFSSGGLVTLWPNAVAGYKRDIVRDVLMGLATLWLVFFPVTALSVDRLLRGTRTPVSDMSEPDVTV